LIDEVQTKSLKNISALKNSKIKNISISDRFPKNMPAILVLAVFNTVFVNPDIYWHRMFETEQGMP